MDAKTIGGVEVTPELVASLFWHLGSDEQADFFAALEREAGSKLCLQMAWVVTELIDRSGRGDIDGLSGFRTMFAHAESYPEAAAEWRADSAKRQLAALSQKPTP